VGYAQTMSVKAERDRMYVNILFDKKTLEEIDDFRFKQRFASRTEAIRWLIEHALKQKPKRAKEA
jgi:metal-responsive CopG/Arc/MetJ family transcriptional regulator